MKRNLHISSSTGLIVDIGISNIDTIYPGEISILQPVDVIIGDEPISVIINASEAVGAGGATGGTGGHLPPLTIGEIETIGNVSGGEIAGAGSEGGNSSLVGKLRGEDVTLSDISVIDIQLTKRNSNDLALLRNDFNSNVRKQFLVDLGKDTDYLRKAGFSEVDIIKIQNGYVPTGWQVHHKIPLDAGGTNEFSNFGVNSERAIS